MSPPESGAARTRERGAWRSDSRAAKAYRGELTSRCETPRGAAFAPPLPEIWAADQLSPHRSANVTGFSDPPASTADTTDGASGSEQVSTGTWEWSSLVRRLHAPTPWRRNSWIVARVALTLCLMTLAAKLALSRTSRPAFSANRNTVLVGTLDAPATPTSRRGSPAGGRSARRARADRRCCRRTCVECSAALPRAR
jgi:hypothetical protein